MNVEKVLDNDFEGYCLFNDVEDFKIQVKNQATMLANIIEDQRKNKEIMKDLARGYFDSIPLFNKKKVLELTESILIERGFEFHG